jgi:hypothetical protein
MTFHDTQPTTPERRHREVEMKRLILLLQANLDSVDEATVPAVVANAMTETGFTSQAASRLKTLLSKVGKPAYEIAIKIISDIGSATAKKMFGL